VVVLLIVATVLSLVAGAMAIVIRGAEQVAHRLHALQAWHVDAYACAFVAALALLAWAAFFGATWRRIAANRQSGGPFHA